MKEIILSILLLGSCLNSVLVNSDNYDLSIRISFAMDRVIGGVFNCRKDQVCLPCFPNAKFFYISCHSSDGTHLYFPTDIKETFFNQIFVSGDLTNRHHFRVWPGDKLTPGQFFFPQIFKGKGFPECFMKEKGFPETLDNTFYGYFLVRKPFGERGVFFSDVFSFKLKESKILDGGFPVIPPKMIQCRIFVEQKLWEILGYFIRPGDQISCFGDEKLDGHFDFLIFPLYLPFLNLILSLI